MKEHICPRCGTIMEVAEDDDQLWSCPSCRVTLDNDEYNAGHPYYYEYIRDDGSQWGDEPDYSDDSDVDWDE